MVASITSKSMLAADIAPNAITRFKARRAGLEMQEANLIASGSSAFFPAVRSWNVRCDCDSAPFGKVSGA